MSDKSSSEDSQVRFKELASSYQPKLPPKLAQMLPHKKQIQELRDRKAAYDDIRLLLADVNIAVSLDTVYRFCRDVIGEKSARPFKARTPRYGDEFGTTRRAILFQKPGADAHWSGSGIVDAIGNGSNAVQCP
jgi:hypothetical protein